MMLVLATRNTPRRMTCWASTPQAAFSYSLYEMLLPSRPIVVRVSDESSCDNLWCGFVLRRAQETVLNIGPSKPWPGVTSTPSNQPLSVMLNRTISSILSQHTGQLLEVRSFTLRDFLRRIARHLRRRFPHHG
jgi:hypothetical protein